MSKRTPLAGYVAGVGFAAMLALPAMAHADAVTTYADLLFNWAEATYPSVLSSALSSQTIAANGTSYYYRGPYTQSSGAQYFVGATPSASTPRVALLNTASGQGVVDIGSLSSWLATVGVATSASGSEVSTCSATYVLNGGTASAASQSYGASATDTSGVCARSGGILSLTSPTISTSGSTSSLDNSSFYGLNAGVLALGGSNISIVGGSVTTTGSGGNGVFATGVGTSVSLRNVTIVASGQGGHGVDATLGGVLALNNVVASTTGNNGSVIATDRGGGTIAVSGGSFSAGGVDSAGVYSTGNITVADATVSSTGGEAVVVEGGNLAVLSNCALSAAKGTRDRGMFVYQSMSGDASVGNGRLTLNGGSFNWPSTSGPAFYVTNSAATITLNGVALTNSSPVLLKAAADQWGTSGSNGGAVSFSATAQTLTGNVVADSVSSIDLSLSGASSLSGAIDNASTAKSVTLTLDASSTWSVTANSHLAGLTETAGTTSAALSNIASNGYNVYYKSSASKNAWLSGGTYTLTGGGKLIPE